MKCGEVLRKKLGRWQPFQTRLSYNRNLKWTHSVNGSKNGERVRSSARLSLLPLSSWFISYPSVIGTLSEVKSPPKEPWKSIGWESQPVAFHGWRWPLNLRWSGHFMLHPEFESISLSRTDTELQRSSLRCSSRSSFVILHRTPSSLSDTETLGFLIM